MKKLIMTLTVAIAAAMPLMAETEYANGYTWTYRINGDTAEIYKGSLSAAISPDPTGAVTIPATLGGKPMTSIGDDAFCGCNWLTGVTIPNSVTNIGASAFWVCGGLKSVTIPNSVTSIGASAFFECGLTSVTIGNGVTSIGDDAFCYCYDLTSVTIGNGVTSIGNYAFYGCSGLTSMMIPNSVTSIGEQAFWSCSGLKSMTIGNGVTSIGHGAFIGCSGLKSLTIPNGVTSIGGHAFWGCSGLKSVTIGNGVTSIGNGAFEDCSSLTSVTIPNGVTNIGGAVFLDCSRLKNVILPTWCKNTHVYKSGGEYRLTTETIPGLESSTSTWQEYLGLASKVKITFKDGSGSSGGGEVTDIWKKAQTVNGAVFKDGKAVGIVQVKVGKANKNGEVAVSGTITGLDGKKLAAKGGKVGVNGETATATLAVKDGTTATVTIGKDGVSGSWNGAEIKAADVGGDWMRDGAKVYVDATSLPAGTIAELLPDGEPVIPKGGKWAFNKAAGVKLSKDKSKDERDTSKGKTNLSGLKLTYTPKAGTFKGSFKVYALEGADGAKKLKKYTASVTGVVVDGKGYGQATIKKPVAGPWAVTVE